MKRRFEPFKCFAVLLAVACLLAACQKISPAPAADARPKIPTAELNEAALSDYELIFGEEPGKPGAAKTDSRPDENGHYPEGVYLKLGDVSWPDLLTRNWTDTAGGKRFKGRAFPVTLTIETQPQGDWIRQLVVDYAFPGDAKFRELSSFQASPELFQSECKAVSSALLDLKDQIGTAEFDRSGLSPESMEGIRFGQLLCGGQQQVRNMVTRFEFEQDRSRLTWTFDAVPFKTLPLRRASEQALLEPDAAKPLPDIAVCMPHEPADTETVILRGVRSACRDQELTYGVQTNLSDAAKMLKALSNLKEQGCRAVILIGSYPVELSAIQEAAGPMPVILMDHYLSIETDGRQTVMIFHDPRTGHRAVGRELAKTVGNSIPKAPEILFQNSPNDDVWYDRDTLQIHEIQQQLRQTAPTAQYIYLNEQSTQAGGYQDWMQDFLCRNGPSDGFVSDSLDMQPNFAVVMKTMGMNPAGCAVYGYGLTPETLAALKGGDLSGLIYNDQINAGRLAVSTAVDLLNGQTVEPVRPVPDVLLTEQTVVDFLMSDHRPDNGALKSSDDQTALSESNSSETGAEATWTDTDLIHLYLAYNGWKEGPFDLSRFNRLLESKGYPYILHIENRQVDARSGYTNWRFAPEKAPDDIVYQNAFKPLKAGYHPDAVWRCGQDWPQVLLDSRNSDHPIDLFVTTNRVTALELPLDDWVEQGIASDLTAFMETERGQQLQNAYPQPLWQALNQNGRYYALPGRLKADPQHAFYWVNQRLAKQYGIETDRWSADLWSHTDELMRVWEGERYSESFSLFNGEPLGRLSNPLLTGIYSDPLWNNLPIIYDEERGQYQCIYDHDIFIKWFEWIESLAQSGCLTYTPQSETVDTYLITTVKPEKHPEDYTAIGYWQCKVANPFESLVSITAWSKHQAEAFDLMTAIYTDSELNDALSAGEMLRFNNPFIGAAVSDAFQVYADTRLYSDICGKLPKITACKDEVIRVLKVMEDIHMRSTPPGQTRFRLTKDRALLREAGIIILRLIHINKI